MARPLILLFTYIHVCTHPQVHIYLYCLVYFSTCSGHTCTIRALLYKVCLRMSASQYLRQTSRDQKPHKSAAFSSDRMYSGYLMKVAVKPSPPIWMFHFNICTPWDFSQYRLCSSAIIPFNCKNWFRVSAVGRVTRFLTETLFFYFSLRLIYLDFFDAAGLCDCHWDPRLHESMWGRRDASSVTDGGESVCSKPARFYEEQRFTHRKDSTSGLQAEWVTVPLLLYTVFN